MGEFGATITNVVLPAERHRPSRPSRCTRPVIIRCKWSKPALSQFNLFSPQNQLLPGNCLLQASATLKPGTSVHEQGTVETRGGPSESFMVCNRIFQPTPSTSAAGSTFSTFMPIPLSRNSPDLLPLRQASEIGFVSQRPVSHSPRCRLRDSPEIGLVSRQPKPLLLWHLPSQIGFVWEIVIFVQLASFHKEAPRPSKGDRPTTGGSLYRGRRTFLFHPVRLSRPP